MGRMRGIFNRSALLPARDGRDTHTKALRQDRHRFVARLDLGTNSGGGGRILVQSQMHRFSSSKTSRAKSKPRREPINQSSGTRQVGTGTIVDATIISAPPSTKNKDKQRDPDMHQTKKG